MTFTLLSEISDSTLIRLTNMQKSVLLVVFSSQTPLLAYEAVTGNEYIIDAREFLKNNQLIRQDESGLNITSEGLDALMSNGLIDEQENITEQGQELVDSFREHKIQMESANIKFNFLKSLT